MPSDKTVHFVIKKSLQKRDSANKNIMYLQGKAYRKLKSLAFPFVPVIDVIDIIQANYISSCKTQFADINLRTT